MSRSLPPSKPPGAGPTIDDAFGAGRKGDPRVVFVTPPVLLVTLEGYLEATTGHAIATAIDRGLEASRGRIHLFFDLERVDNYRSEVRTGLTRILLARRPKVASIQVLTRSKIVKMGVAVANLTLGGVRTFESRVAFERALAQAKAGTEET